MEPRCCNGIQGTSEQQQGYVHIAVMTATFSASMARLLFRGHHSYHAFIWFLWHFFSLQAQKTLLMNNPSAHTAVIFNRC